MSDLMGRMAASISIVALVAALLMACGSSADQSDEAPNDARQPDAATQPTPAVVTTPVEPTGDGSVELAVIVGVVGSGICDATVDDCVIAVNDSGLQEPEATIRIPLSFAP